METKNVTFSQIPDLTENRVNNKNNFCESQINFLRKEGQNDNLIINDLLEQPFYTSTPKPLNTSNPDKSTKAVYEDSYKYPEKKPAKACNLKDQSKNSIDATNLFLSYHLMETQLIHREKIAH